MKKFHQLLLAAIAVSCFHSSCIKTSSLIPNLSGGGTDTSTSNGSGSTFPVGTVFTFAGDGNQGYVDATGTSAEFASPIALTVDNLGNVYVVDGLNYAIRKITSDGVVSTLAGNGFPGYADGQGTNAQFAAPQGIIVDAQGNVYVSEGNGMNTQRIRKITPGGLVSTIAGNGKAGFQNGPSSEAEFNGAGALALDGSGNLYIGDVVNERIRKISGTGVVIEVSTFAGNGATGAVNGAAATSEFDIPEGLAFDPSWNLYVADEENYCIRKITPGGMVSNFAGSKGNAGFANGTGTDAQFVNPVAICSDSIGNIYVTEGATNNCIRKISPGGVVTSLSGTQAPGFTDGTLATAQFNNPCSIAIGPKGNIFIADAFNYRIRKIILN